MDSGSLWTCLLCVRGHTASFSCPQSYDNTESPSAVSESWLLFCFSSSFELGTFKTTVAHATVTEEDAGVWSCCYCCCFLVSLVIVVLVLGFPLPAEMFSWSS